MKARKELGARLREILNILEAREGASALYIQRHLPSHINLPSIRAAIGRLRDAGYDIAYGLKRSSCSGDALYTWERSPVVPQQVVGQSASV